MIAGIAERIVALNKTIAEAPSLGPQFCIGHSYVTPELDPDLRMDDGWAWFREKVETEIRPLLEEYWYDSPETARVAHAKLVDGL